MQEMDFAKSFINKLYNSANFVKMALEKGKVPKRRAPHKHLNIFDIWILNRLNQTVKEVTEAYDEFNFYTMQ
jgi:valyl-tRNA synthetase